MVGSLKHRPRIRCFEWIPKKLPNSFIECFWVHLWNHVRCSGENTKLGIGEILENG